MRTKGEKASIKFALTMRIHSLSLSLGSKLNDDNPLGNVIKPANYARFWHKSAPFKGAGRIIGIRGTFILLPEAAAER